MKIQKIFILLIVLILTGGNLAGSKDVFDEARYRERFLEDSFFAIQTHVNGEADMPRLKALGIRTVRVDLHFSGLEPQKGVFDFSPHFMTRSLDLGVKEGLDMLPCLTHAPVWALTKENTWPNDTAVGDVEELMFRLATKYKGKIKYWECMNEPIVFVAPMSTWKDRFVTLLRAFRKGIKRADPENKVVLCAFGGNEPGEFEVVYKYGGKGLFDVVGCHPYTRPRMPEDGGYVEMIKGMWEMMKKYGDTGKPIWVTEIGWNGVEPSKLGYMKSKFPNHQMSCTEEDQARGMARTLLISATVPCLERVYLFHLAQACLYNQVSEDNEDQWGLYGPWLGNAGDLSKECRPKEAYFAVQTAVKMMKESTFKGRVPLGKRLWALIFERKEESVIALWSLDEGVKLVLEDTTKIKGVTSMVGSPVLVEKNTLELSGRPIYLRVDKANMEAVKEQIRKSKKQGVKLFTISMGLDMEKSKSDRPVLDVMVTNTSGRIQTLPSVALQATSPWKLTSEFIDDPDPLKSEEVKSYSAILAGPVKTRGEISLEVKGTIHGTRPFVQEAKTIRYALIGPKPAEFKADGDLKEWPAEAGIDIGKAPEQRKISEWKGLSDCSGRWFAAWDAESLYFAAEIQDDVPFQTLDQKNGANLWTGDGIQIGIDTQGDAKPSANVPTYDGVNDVEFGLGLGKDGPVCFFWVNPAGQTGICELKDLAIVRDEARKETRYEAVIPWSVLGVKGSPAGKWMGMNLIVNDNDGAGRKGWLEWAPGIGETKDPSQFPKVIFVMK